LTIDGRLSTDGMTFEQMNGLDTVLPETPSKVDFWGRIFIEAT